MVFTLLSLFSYIENSGCFFFFFFQAEDGIRDVAVTGVQTCALPILGVVSTIRGLSDLGIASTCSFVIGFPDESSEELSSTISMGAELKLIGAGMIQRSEERRVGKECRSRWSPYH